MKIQTFARKAHELVEIEAEVTLLPGLPMIHIIGRPDATLRESTKKIKSAIRKCGFQFPRAQQVLVNLRPNHFKKTSEGLELAIAAGILWSTGQIPIDKNDLPAIYGELTLDGHVLAPSDVADIECSPVSPPILTGRAELPFSLRQGHYQIDSLAELARPQWIDPSDASFKIEPPELSPLKFSAERARLLAIMAAGEHPTLLAGQAGSGKSTAARTIHSYLRPPDEKQFAEIQRIHRHDAALKFRPLRSPHHTATAKSLIGGGNPILAGELTRAHNGQLLLDELLEFKPNVIEALREAMDRKELRLTSLGDYATLPADNFIVATTNLCACGRYTPKNDEDCRCSNYIRHRYMNRLSGPLLDRMHLLVFFENHPASEGRITGEKIRDRVRSAVNFAKYVRDQVKPNSKLNEDEIEILNKNVDQRYGLPESITSFRRRKAYLSVARTIADLDSSEFIERRHLTEAEKLTLTPFTELHTAS